MITINNLPECKTCEKGYLLPLSKVVYEYSPYGNREQTLRSADVLLIGEWKCSNPKCDTHIKQSE